MGMALALSHADMPESPLLQSVEERRGVDEERGLRVVTRGAEGNGGKESSFARFPGHSACSPDPSGMLLGRSTFENVSEIGVLASTSFLLSPSSDGISTISAGVCLRPYLSKSSSVCTRRSFS